MCFEVKDLLFSLTQFTCIRTDVTLCVAQVQFFVGIHDNIVRIVQ